MGQSISSHLFTSFECGNEAEILSILQKNGESYNSIFRESTSSKDVHKNLFVHYAGLCGLDSIFRICCIRSSDNLLFSTTKDGRTIFHCICDRCDHVNHCLPVNKIKCLKYFINFRNGMFCRMINAKDSLGCTCMHYLVRTNQSYLFEILLNLKIIDLKIRDNNGRTVYDLCLLNQNLDMLIMMRDRLINDDDILLNFYDYSEEEKINDIRISTNLPPNFIKELLKEYNGNVEMILIQYYNNHLKPMKEVECEVCCEKRNASDYFWLGCNDCYCKICWKFYIENEIRNGKVDIKCMNSNCNYKLSEDDIYSLISKSMQKKYEMFKEKAMIENDKSLFECPFPNCKEIVKVMNVENNNNNYNNTANNSDYDQIIKIVDNINTATETNNNNNNVSNNNNNKFSFTNCDLECRKHHRFCGKCKKDVHIPCSCEDLENWSILLSNNKIITRDPDTINYNWISENTKFCPKCRVRIEKNKGCNHMTCEHCKYQFCWLCLCDWSLHGEETGGFFHCNRIAQQIIANKRIKDQMDKAKFDFCSSKYVLIKEKIESIKIMKQTTLCSLLLKCEELLDYSYIYFYYHIESNQEPFFYSCLDKLENLINILNNIVINKTTKVTNSETISLIDQYNDFKAEFLENISNGIPVTVHAEEEGEGEEDEYHREFIIPENIPDNGEPDVVENVDYNVAALLLIRNNHFTTYHPNVILRGRSVAFDEYHIYDNAPLADGDLYPFDMIRQFYP